MPDHLLPPEIPPAEPYPVSFPVRENNPIDSWASVSSARLARITELERENERLRARLEAQSERARRQVYVTDNNGTVAQIHAYIPDLYLWVHRWVLVPGAQRRSEEEKEVAGGSADSV